MPAKQYIIVYFIVQISILSFVKRSMGQTHTSFNDSLITRNYFSVSFDFQPRLIEKTSPFNVKSTIGWNINYQSKLIRFNKRNSLFLNFNLSRRIERCEIKNIKDPIFNESDISFNLKLLITHFGILYKKEFNKLTFVSSINWGYAFDNEFSYKYKLRFKEKVCDTFNFNYNQSYSIKKSFPIMLQIGIIRKINKKLNFNMLIYNNEFKTNFYQDYQLSYCNNQVFNSKNLIANRFGLIVGLGYKI